MHIAHNKIEYGSNYSFVFFDLKKKHIEYKKIDF
jgi:hypothetical protein